MFFELFGVLSFV